MEEAELVSQLFLDSVRDINYYISCIVASDSHLYTDDVTNILSKPVTHSYLFQRIFTNYL